MYTEECKLERSVYSKAETCAFARTMNVQHSNVQSIAFYVHCCCLESIACACGVKSGGKGKHPCINVECMLFFCFLTCRKCQEEKLFAVFFFFLVFVDGLHVKMQLSVAFLVYFLACQKSLPSSAGKKVIQFPSPHSVNLIRKKKQKKIRRKN